MAENMKVDNAVTVSGLLHHVKSEKKSDRYFLFSIKQEAPWDDGSIRKDFLISRAFIPDVQAQVRDLPMGTRVRVRGFLQSSRGSGEMYIYAQEVEILRES